MQAKFARVIATITVIGAVSVFWIWMSQDTFGNDTAELAAANMLVRAFALVGLARIAEELLRQIWKH
jgi:hypothetical protein